MEKIDAGQTTWHESVEDKYGARPKDGAPALVHTEMGLYGHVALISTYGSDEIIAVYAGQSYGKNNEQKTPAETRRLIRYLMRHKHTSPFEQCEVTFHLRLPIFVVRQLIRHRTANVNELSARYTELEGEFYVPALKSIARQSTTNKQGREEPLSAAQAEQVQQLFVEAQEQSVRIYKRLLEEYGVARELARVSTSVGMYTEMYWKCDLHNFFHFLKLRMDPHAQQEIREFAWTMYRAAAKFFPLSFGAYDDYVRDAYTLSGPEIELLAQMLRGDSKKLPEMPRKPMGMTDREYKDFCFFVDSALMSHR